ncbi:ERVV2 protein, partial [Cinclus mexicanus]|nr:ERVV2 protein [Cinclus mexicanus]
ILVHSVIRALIPCLGVIELERAFVNISAVIEHIEQQTTDTILALHEEEIHYLSHMVLQNRMDFNFLLAAQGVCAIINTTYCFYVDQSRRIKKDLA